MRLLKHAETRYPVMLVLLPFPKGKESQNYNTWYNLITTALMKQKISKSIFLQQLQEKKPHPSNTLADPTVLLQLGTRNKLTLFPSDSHVQKSTLCLFFFFFFFFLAAPNSSVLQHVSQLVKMTHKLISAFWIGSPIKILLVMHILKRTQSVCSWVSGISIA